MGDPDSKVSYFDEKFQNELIPHKSHIKLVLERSSLNVRAIISRFMELPSLKTIFSSAGSLSANCLN